MSVWIYLALLNKETHNFDIGMAGSSMKHGISGIVLNVWVCLVVFHQETHNFDISLAGSHL